MMICSLIQSELSSEDISKLHIPDGPSLADQVALTIGENNLLHYITFSITFENQVYL